MNPNPYPDAVAREADQDMLLRGEVVRLLHGGLPAALIANALLAMLLVGVQWPAVTPALAGGWLVSMAAVLGWRAHIYWRHARSTGHAEADWLGLYRLGAIATGVVWGAAGLVLFPHGQIAHQVFLAFVLAGVSAGAITSLTSDRVASLGFVTPALSPLAVQFIFEGGTMALAMGLMVLLFLVFVAASTARLRQHLVDNVSLRADTSAQERILRRQQQLSDVIARAQAEFIRETDRRKAFDGLLTDMLTLTGSEYGFIGEVLRTPAGAPYLKTYAITNIAWNDATRAFYAANAPKGMEFMNLKTLFGAALVSGEPVIANDPYHDPRRGGLPEGHPALNAFLGIPVHHGAEIVAMLGVANRPGGYDRELIEFLQPLLVTLGQLVVAARIQEKHYKGERRLRSIIDGTRIGTWEWNVQTGETVFNERWAEIIGYTLAELEPISIQTWLDLVHPDDKLQSGAMLERHFTGELDYYDMQCRMRHRDGRWVWVHDRGCVVSRTEDGKPLLMLGTHADITEQKQAEEALRASEARLRGLFELSPVGIALNDYETGAFIDANDALIAPTGYTREEFLRLRYWDVTPKKYADREAEQLEALDETGRYTHYEKEYIRKDGSRYPVLLNGMTIDEPSGRKLIWSIIEDISERKRMERMKNEFVSIVSHELRTPLTSISGALGLIAGGVMGPLPEHTRQMVEIAHKNSQRLTYLINDLLDMEKLMAGKFRFDPQTLWLMPLVEQAVRNNQAYADQRGVHLHIAGLADDVLIDVDPERLQQVIANLLSNAVKFSPEGARVMVSVLRGDTRVRVEVKDEGPGVPADFRASIFQKFSQADSSDARQKGGTGLGLAISRELIERMGGCIGFESTEGQGATFFFELPRSPDLCLMAEGGRA
jgi:PAS domain S-box-containing protein